MHSPHGFFPVWIASSRVLDLTRIFSEIYAADLQSARWKPCEFSSTRDRPRRTAAQHRGPCRAYPDLHVAMADMILAAVCESALASLPSSAQSTAGRYGSRQDRASAQ